MTAIRPLTAGVDLANKADADLFISVHNNSTTGPGLSKVQGTQVMYDEKKPDKDSKDFAQICLEEVTKSCGSVDKGLVAGNDIFYHPNGSSTGRTHRSGIYDK